MAQKFTVPIVVRNLSASSSDALAVSVDGDTHDRIKFEAGGRIVWGTGASAGDVNLYRPSADLLKTDDAFQAAGVITLTSDGEPTAALPDGALAVDTTNETLYVRANNAWVVASGGGGASVTVSDTPPLDPAEGDLWFESDTGDIYVYYSTTWVDIGGSSVANIAVTTTPPSSPVNGDLWFDTDTAKTYVYYNDGTSGQWVEIGAASAAASGQDGYIQFATGGTFNSASALVWDNANAELEVTGTVIADNVTTSGTTATTSLTVDSQYVTPYTGRKNAIINGDMRIAQRSTSQTISSGAGTMYYACDRYGVDNYTWSGGGQITLSQESAVVPNGFNNALKVSVGSTALTYNSGGYSAVKYSVEGYDASRFYDSTATLSFWVRASVAGTYSILVANNWWGTGSADRGLVVEYSISQADTWEKKSVTINFASGTSSGTWGSANGYGILLQWFLGANANRVGNTYLNSWSNWSTYEVMSSNATQLLTNANATFYLTGVQLELGDKATPFEHRSYGEELALCQRYYHDARGHLSFAGMIASDNYFNGMSASFPTTMRATPSVTVYDLGGTAGQAYYVWGSSGFGTLSISVASGSVHQFRVYRNFGSAAGSAVTALTSGYIASAEL